MHTETESINAPGEIFPWSDTDRPGVYSCIRNGLGTGGSCFEADRVELSVCAVVCGSVCPFAYAEQGGLTVLYGN